MSTMKFAVPLCRFNKRFAQSLCPAFTCRSTGRLGTAHLYSVLLVDGIRALHASTLEDRRGIDYK